ncbi:MAG: YjjG family noncanonical pyrimidine nucleotidase [Brumimicrobium sp.]|nr:YjjG family noncanonical pyrimidine nucleotidase [Brumimicrobium sp.]
MSAIQHIFFDLDRTLWDFETNSKAALQTIFEELKLAEFISNFDDFHTVYREINAQYWSDYSKGVVSKEDLRSGRFLKTLQKFDINDTELGTTIGDKYIQISPHQTNLFPGTKETLEQLKKDNFRLHIITNGFKETQFIKLEKSGIIQYFEDILCSEEIGVNKPDPKVFNAALRRTGAKNVHSMMIGDDFNADIIGAENCGIRAVLFDPYGHYNDRIDLEKISSLEELPVKIIGL